MLQVAIIGSNGFIGKHLVNELKEKSNINIFLFNKTVKSSSDIKIDLLDSDLIAEQFAKIDIVYYLASSTIPSTSWDNPLAELDNNLIPFIKFTECISKIGVKKIIFVSSAGTIYGPSKFKVSENSNKEPFSPYGIIKLTIENFLNYFKSKYNLNFDIYRISNVYGEGQDTSKGLGIINTFIENIISKNEIQIFGDGKNLRNYIYVKDVAKILSFSIDRGLDTTDIFNLSSSDTLSINELIEQIKKNIKTDFNVVYTKTRGSDNSYIDLDNSKLLNEFSNFEFTSIKNGLIQTFTHLIKEISQPN